MKSLYRVGFTNTIGALQIQQGLCNASIQKRLCEAPQDHVHVSIPTYAHLSFFLYI